MHPAVPIGACRWRRRLREHGPLHLSPTQRPQRPGCELQARNTLQQLDVGHPPQCAPPPRARGPTLSTVQCPLSMFSSSLTRAHTLTRRSSLSRGTRAVKHRNVRRAQRPGQHNKHPAARAFVLISASAAALPCSGRISTARRYIDSSRASISGPQFLIATCSSPGPANYTQICTRATYRRLTPYINRGHCKYPPASHSVHFPHCPILDLVALEAPRLLSSALPPGFYPLPFLQQVSYCNTRASLLPSVSFNPTRLHLS